MRACVPMDDMKHVLLDLDGTLLDKHFDDFFWGHLVPEKYAERHSMDVESARAHLFATYKRHEGTLNWTDIDFWSEELSLDIPALKEQVRHLVDVHPHVEHFLSVCRQRGKRICLLTNAHYKSIDMKFRETGIGKYFDDIIPSHDMGAPKEDLLFWKRAMERLGFAKDDSIFVDDTEEVLRTARLFGMRYTILKLRASSKVERGPSEEFPYIYDFDDLVACFKGGS